MKLKMLIYLEMAGVFLMVCCVHTAQGATSRIREQRLGAIPEDRLHDTVTSRSRHRAWIIRRGPKMAAVVDAEQGPEYDEIAGTDGSGWLDYTFAEIDGLGWLDYSGDGERWAYLARRGDNWHVVIDGYEGPPYDQVGYIRSSSHRVAYQATRGGKSFMVVDGVPSPGYDSVEEPRFSSKGKRIAYIATKGRRQCLVVDGKEGPLFDEIDYVDIAFSQDEEHVGYVGCNGQVTAAGLSNRQFTTIIDGKARPSYDWISSLGFSPDGKHVAYRASRRDARVMVVDHEEGREYLRVALARPMRRSAFSPQGNRTAYHAQHTPDKRFLVVDGKEGPEYDRIMNFEFSANGRHFGYEGKTDRRGCVVDGLPGPMYEAAYQLRFSSDGLRWCYEAYENKKWFVVVDGQPGQPYDLVGGLTFSPDGNRIAYGVIDGRRWRMIIDGKPGPTYEDVGLPVFSPDSKHLRYSVVNNGISFISVDGKPGPHFDKTFTPAFSPDGRHLVYWAQKGDKQLMVLDGVAGPEYDEICTQWPKFTEDGKHLLYWARRDSKWLLVVNDREGPEYDWTSKTGVLADGAYVYLAARDGVLYRVTHRLPAS